MPKKEITCDKCGLRETIRYPKGTSVVYCSGCGKNFILESSPFRNKISLSESGEIVASEDIKKGELLEKCPLIEWEQVPSWRFMNDRGHPVIPLGYVLRYSKGETGNVFLKVKTHFLFVYALTDITKSHPITIRSSDAQSN